MKREVGLGCHSQLDSSLIQFSTAGSPDSVTLFRTAVERESCEVHKLLRTVEVPATLTSTVLVVVVVVVVVGLFCFC